MAFLLPITDSIIDASPLSIQVVDGDGLTVRVNPAYVRLFGLDDAGDVVDVINIRTDPAMVEQGFAPFIERAFQGETVYAPALAIHGPEIPTRMIRTTLVPSVDGAGAVEYVVIMLEDVTELSASQRVLEHRHQQIGALQKVSTSIANNLDTAGVVSSALDAMKALLACQASAVWTREPSGKWNLIGSRGLSPEYEDGMRALYPTGADTDKLPGADLKRRVPVLCEDVQADPALQPLAEFLGNEGYRRFIGITLQSGQAMDGSLAIYWTEPGPIDRVDVETAQLLADQIAVGLHNAALYEETHRMREDLEVRVRERTEELRSTHDEMVANERLAAVGFLAAQVAHELRNPLNVISTSMYFLKSKYPQPDEKVTRHFETVTRAVDQCADTINQLMNLVDSDAPQKDEVDMNQLAQRVVQDRADTGTRFETSLERHLPCVFGDWTHLAHALRALLNNAEQSAGPGSVVHVETHLENGNVVLSVGGPRPPLSDKEHERMFEPFFTSATRWTGLSLSVARRIARKHGGNVEVTEEPNVTWLRMTLPALNGSKVPANQQK